MSVSEYLAPLFGRLALGWFFLAQVATYGGNWDKTVLDMMIAGVPVAPFVLALVLFALVLGSVSLIFGFQARYGALLLFAATVIAAVSMHDYWRIVDDAAARQAQFEAFIYSVAVAGGLLLLLGLGPGPLAVDNRQAKKK